MTGLGETRSRPTCRRMTAARSPSISPSPPSSRRCIEHIMLLMEQFGIEVIDTRFSYSVRYPRRRLRTRFRLRDQGAAPVRDREVPATPAASAPVRRADPLPVEAAERPQPVQLRQHGHASESGRFLLGLPVQDTEAHVRQLPAGDERVRHAGVSLFEVSRILRHRVGDAHADVGPGDAAHLRQPVRRLPGQDIPEPARPEGVPPEGRASWSRTRRA